MFDRILILQHRGGEYLSLNISGLTSDRKPIRERFLFDWDTAKDRLVGYDK